MPLLVWAMDSLTAITDRTVINMVGGLLLAWAWAVVMAVEAADALSAAADALADASSSPVTLTLYSRSTRSLTRSPPLLC